MRSSRSAAWLRPCLLGVVLIVGVLVLCGCGVSINGPDDSDSPSSWPELDDAVGQADGDKRSEPAREPLGGLSDQEFRALIAWSRLPSEASAEQERDACRKIEKVKTALMSVMADFCDEGVAVAALGQRSAASMRDCNAKAESNAAQLACWKRTFRSMRMDMRRSKRTVEKLERAVDARKLRYECKQALEQGLGLSTLIDVFESVDDGLSRMLKARTRSQAVAAWADMRSELEEAERRAPGAPGGSTTACRPRS